MLLREVIWSTRVKQYIFDNSDEAWDFCHRTPNSRCWHSSETTWIVEVWDIDAKDYPYS